MYNIMYTRSWDYARIGTLQCVGTRPVHAQQLFDRQGTHGEQLTLQGGVGPRLV